MSYSGQQRGAYTPIYIGTETTFGSTAAFAQKLYYKSESLKYDRNLITSATLRGSRQPIKPTKGNANVAGDITVELGPQHGLLLKHAFGSYGISGAGAPYTHTFKIDELPPGLTIEKRFIDLAAPKYFQYTGCKVNQFKISAKTEGPIEATFSFLGKGETIDTATGGTTQASFDASPTDLGLTPFDGFNAAMYVDNVAIGICTAIDFTLDNGLDGNTYVIGGAGARRSLPEGIAKVTGTTTILFESADFYEYAKNSTEKAIKLVFFAGTTEVASDGSAAGLEKLSIFLKEVIFKPEAPAVQGPTGVTLNAPFEAYYYDDTSYSSAAAAVLLSPTADYNA